MSLIQVTTGRLVNVEALRPCDVHLEDIATALSNLCRFTGHVREFYSVAQHCVLVSQATAAYFEAVSGGGVPDYAPWSPWKRLAAKLGLLHDAHEAYIGDVSRPLRGKYDGLAELKSQLDAAIFQRFGVHDWGDPGRQDVLNAVQDCDEAMLATEKRDVLTRADVTWPELKAEPFEAVIVPVGPKEARRMFIDRFNELWAEGQV